jgi:hypothetical protein
MFLHKIIEYHLEQNYSPLLILYLLLMDKEMGELIFHICLKIKELHKLNKHETIKMVQDENQGIG